MYQAHKDKVPLNWNLFTVAEIKAKCDAGSAAHPDWHPNLFAITLDGYLSDLAGEDRWWLSQDAAATSEPAEGAPDLIFSCKVIPDMYNACRTHGSRR